MRFTRQRLHFTFSGVDGFWQSVPRESPRWTGMRGKGRVDAVFLGELDKNTHINKNAPIREETGSQNSAWNPNVWKRGYSSACAWLAVRGSAAHCAGGASGIHQCLLTGVRSGKS